MVGIIVIIWIDGAHSCWMSWQSAFTIFGSASISFWVKAVTDMVLEHHMQKV